MNFNCPVCNKAGLSDFTVDQTICPQCNSDLTPFLLLNTISKSRISKSSWGIFIGIISIAVLFIFLYFNTISQKKEIIIANSKATSQFKDSIAILNSKIEPKLSTGPVKKGSTGEIVIPYKVRKNDCASKIAKFFYNDSRMFKQIETDNGLKQPYILSIGQVLSIKIKQD